MYNYNFYRDTELLNEVSFRRTRNVTSTDEDAMYSAYEFELAKIGLQYKNPRAGHGFNFGGRITLSFDNVYYVPIIYSSTEGILKFNRSVSDLKEDMTACGMYPVIASLNYLENINGCKGLAELHSRATTSTDDDINNTLNDKLVDQAIHVPMHFKPFMDPDKIETRKPLETITESLTEDERTAAEEKNVEITKHNKKVDEIESLINDYVLKVVIDPSGSTSAERTGITEKDFLKDLTDDKKSLLQIVNVINKKTRKAVWENVDSTSPQKMSVQPEEATNFDKVKQEIQELSQAAYKDSVKGSDIFSTNTLLSIWLPGAIMKNSGIELPTTIGEDKMQKLSSLYILGLLSQEDYYQSSNYIGFNTNFYIGYSVERVTYFDIPFESIKVSFESSIFPYINHANINNSARLQKEYSFHIDSVATAEFLNTDPESNIFDKVLIQNSDIEKNQKDRKLKMEGYFHDLSIRAEFHLVRKIGMNVFKGFFILGGVVNNAISLKIGAVLNGFVL